MAFSTNTAIWPRVTTVSGQKSGGLVEQPDVMPASTSASIQLQNGEVTGTSPNVLAGTATAWRKFATEPALAASVRTLSAVAASPMARPLKLCPGLEKYGIRVQAIPASVHRVG